MLYTSVLRSSAGWKAKDFKGMTFDQIEEKFFPVWEKIQEFVPMDSKLESKILKRLGIQLAQKSLKKLKTTKASEEVYIEALQEKRPIIDWEVYGEGQIKYGRLSALEPGQGDFQHYRPYRGQREDALGRAKKAL
ncbi:hypothetical protein Tco_1068101 [Tanacetum coccineum]|uniref:Uncharacterized protein n=1 Tax=Tanacetum coccineum TaxID=301880 RepID=A0ABQ5HG52_9ASTR